MIVSLHISSIGLIAFIRIITIYSIRQPSPSLLNWLRSYGYMDAGASDHLTTAPKLRNALKLVRIIGSTANKKHEDRGRNEDEEEFKWIDGITHRPRCGNPDFDVSRRRTKRSNVLNDKPTNNHYRWNKPTLYWSAQDTAVGLLNKHQVRGQIRLAVDDWRQFLPIELHEVPPEYEHADIRITFEVANHGDGYNFDGPGGIVGHAFAPTDGRVHLDADEMFTDSYDHSEGQFNLRLVVSHEIGHALGLAHSLVPESIMFPFYCRRLQLISDRIKTNSFYDVIHSDQKYGALSQDDHDAFIKIVQDVRRPYCTHLPDAVASIPWFKNSIYVFDMQYAFIVQSNKVPRRYHIENLFPGLEPNVMAAVYSEITGSTYMFKDNRVWKYAGFTLEAKYPKRLSKLAPFNPTGAIFHHGRIFLIKGNVWFLFDEEYENQAVLTGTHPCEVQECVFAVDELITGAPHNLSRAFTYANHHYLLTDDFVYAYAWKNAHMIDGYPKKRKNANWLLC